jgi:acetate kinase
MAQYIHGTPVAVGHRVVHGGPHLRSHQLITPQVLDQLRSAIHFAPLHIPQALTLIASAQSIFPSAAHFACFDDAFHQTIPEVASHFALPNHYFDAGIRRNGFHGISYESLVDHFGATLPERAIFAHLGNGASLCALRNGKSIDTTMGLTPTGGIPMGTRSGDLDPGVILYLLRNEKLDADNLENLLNHQSGLLALSSGESDVKTLEERAAPTIQKHALRWTFLPLRCERRSEPIWPYWAEWTCLFSRVASESTAAAFDLRQQTASNPLASHQTRFRLSLHRKNFRSRGAVAR